MITVYWSCNAGYSGESDISGIVGLRSFEPESVRKISSDSYGIKEVDLKELEYVFCPAHKDYFKNLYLIRSPIDYDINIDSVNNRMYSSVGTQEDFNSLINVRSVPAKLSSIMLRMDFFTEESSLQISQEPASFHTSNFINNTILIPGKFDVAKWPRFIEVAFHMKKDKVALNIQDPLYYVRFHTEEQIRFKRFLPTQKYNELAMSFLKTKNLKNRVASKLEYYYNILAKYPKIKSMMLEEVKANLLE